MNWTPVAVVDPILSVRDVSVRFKLPKPYVWSKQAYLEVLHDLSFDVYPGTSLGIVGESGSGKSTLGRTLIQLQKVTKGSVHFDGQSLTGLDDDALRPLRADLQMIFQDPQSSLNPRRRIASLLTQPMESLGRLPPEQSAMDCAVELLEMVGLSAAVATRFPHELSGGQRQRIGIARAVAVRPRVIIADEIVSGLDVSSQARILSLLRELSESLGLTLILISHDLSVVRASCDRTLVLVNGRVAEHAPTDELFRFARHPYTRELIRAIPLPEIDPGWLDHSDDTTYIGGLAMQIKGATALVTGANRGIGQAMVDELVKRGASKVYAAARNPSSVQASSSVVHPIALDITDHARIQSVASELGDVDLLINNAGINRMSAFAASDDLQAAREEMEVNYFGTMAMCKAFAPVLKNNGGGAIVNLLSILARVNLPLMGSLCASKAAGLSMVQGLRAELAAQNTAVIAVMPGAVDTDMSRDFPPPKMPASDVVSATLDGIEAGEEEIYPGEMAGGMSAGLAADPKAVEKELANYLPG